MAPIKTSPVGIAVHYLAVMPYETRCWAFRVPGFLRPGRSGRGLQLHGQPVYAGASKASLEPAQITVDAWVKAAAPGPGPSRYVVSKAALADEAASYGLYTGISGGLQFYVFNGTGFTISGSSGFVVGDRASPERRHGSR